MRDHVVLEHAEDAVAVRLGQLGHVVAGPDQALLLRAPQGESQGGVRPAQPGQHSSQLERQHRARAVVVRTRCADHRVVVPGHVHERAVGARAAAEVAQHVVAGESPVCGGRDREPERADGQVLADQALLHLGDPDHRHGRDRRGRRRRRTRRRHQPQRRGLGSARVGQVERQEDDGDGAADAASATNAARRFTRVAASASWTSSAITTEPVTAAGSAGHAGAVAGPTSTTGPSTAASRPASGDAPACQQMSSGSMVPWVADVGEELVRDGERFQPHAAAGPLEPPGGVLGGLVLGLGAADARSDVLRQDGQVVHGAGWADRPDHLAVAVAQPWSPQRARPGRVGGPGGAACCDDREAAGRPGEDATATETGGRRRAGRSGGVRLVMVPRDVIHAIRT